MPSNEKYKQRLENIVARLYMENLPEIEINKLANDTKKEIHREWGTVSESYFTSDWWKSGVIKFSEKYCINDYVLENLIQTMGMTAKRCRHFDDRYYNFILRNINNGNKRIKRQVRCFIWQFPQFLTYKECWEYLISIPKIAPKKESIEILRNIINWNLGNIVECMPENYANIILETLEKHINQNKIHEAVMEYWEKAINKLKYK